MATIQTWKTKYGTSYRASIYVQGRRESATFDSRAKALAWAEETAALLRAGKPLPGELPANDLRLNEAVEKYTMAVAPRKKSNTRRLDQEIGDRLIRYFDGKSLQTITSKDILITIELQPASEGVEGQVEFAEQHK